MVVAKFLKLFIIVFILLYRVGLYPWPLALRHSDKPFGYLIFPPKNDIFPKLLVFLIISYFFYVHHLGAYTALSLLFK